MFLLLFKCSMYRVSARVGTLVAECCLTAQVARPSPHHIHFRLFHNIRQKPSQILIQSNHFRQNRAKRYPKVTEIRHCSYQRTMCRAHGENAGGAMVTKSREVLPANVKPLHYDLTLEPNFKDFTYEGRVVTE